MSELAPLTRQLEGHQDLSPGEAEVAAHALTQPEVAPEEKKAFLAALHAKGETVGEVTTFAHVFRKLARDPQLGDVAKGAIDIVGTGGSGSRGFNISSVTAFIAAAGGIKVLKHGNRAITSQSGSADFLGACGIRMDTDTALLRAAVEELNFCFFFAPAFHPAFKEIVPVRKEMAAEGKRTIFNILGPLINPARPEYQLLGVFATDWVPRLAGALDALGLKNGLAVCSLLPGGARMDEFTTAGTNRVCGFGRLRDLDAAWEAAEVGLATSPADDLGGGTSADNVTLLERILAGKGPVGLVDSLVLNAGAAFYITGKAPTLKDGCAAAREVLLGGAVKDWLERAKAFYSDAN